MKKQQKGFIGVGLLIVIIIGLGVMGGGTYYIVNKNKISTQEEGLLGQKKLVSESESTKELDIQNNKESLINDNRQIVEENKKTTEKIEPTCNSNVVKILKPVKNIEIVGGQKIEIDVCVGDEVKDTALKSGEKDPILVLVGGTGIPNIEKGMFVTGGILLSPNIYRYSFTVPNQVLGPFNLTVLARNKTQPVGDIIPINITTKAKLISFETAYTTENKFSAVVGLGGGDQLVVWGIYSDGIKRQQAYTVDGRYVSSMTYKIQDEGIAKIKIDKNGFTFVEGIKEGKTKITLTNQGVSKTFDVDVISDL